MTGKFVTEKTLQSSSLYFDIRKGCWWGEMLEYIGISPGMLPEIKNSGRLWILQQSGGGYGAMDR